MNEKVFGADQTRTNVALETLSKRNNFSKSVSNKKGIRKEKYGNYLKWSSSSVYHGDKTSELSSENNPNSESANIKLLFNIFSSPAFKVLLDLLHETVVQVGQLYAPPQVALAVFQSDYVPNGIVPSLRYCYEQINIIQDMLSVKKNGIQQVFACEELRSNRVTTTSSRCLKDKLRAYRCYG